MKDKTKEDELKEIKEKTIKVFLAKSTKDGQTETIQEHTYSLIRRYNKLKSLYPSIAHLDWEILRLACIYHDLGKMNTKFQIKLGQILEDKLKTISEIHHGYLSPAYLPENLLKTIYKEDDMRILYQNIYYHHTRKENHSLDELQLTINSDLASHIDEFEFDLLLEREPLNDSYRRYIKNRITEKDGDLFYRYVIAKGLLNKLDYSASAHIPVELENVDLEEKTKYSLTKHGFNLNDLQEYLLKNQNENNIIIASTGIGKTEGALLWIGNSKGFFTLPLKVSINAIYDRIIDENKIGFDKELTGLLHSDTLIEYINRAGDEALEESYLTQTKQLSLPLTVCTLDQLIDFIFKYSGFEIKLATLAYSKLVIDEIQMYDAKMLGHLLASLKYIDKMGGKFSIVTATLPPIIPKFLEDLGVNFKMPDKAFIKKDIKTGEYQVRHKMKVVKNKLNVKDILRDDYANKKVLVIANTVKESQRIFRELKEVLPKGFNINLLHSRFIKKDRKEKEDSIFAMGQLKSSETGIWVTTQIVEASLDIDFDVLHTELSEVSGLFQRMGRAYRNRTYNLLLPNIYVYTNEDKKYPSGIGKSRSIVDIDIFKFSKEALLKYDNKIITEIDKMKIVEEVYDYKKVRKTEYYKQIKKTINEDIERTVFDFDKSEADLREIYSATIIPKCVYEENKDIIVGALEKLKKSKNKLERETLKSQIKDFSLTTELYRLKKELFVDNIYLSRYEKIGIYDFEYDKELGLQ